MRSAPDDFNWHTDKTVAVRSQAALAVYANNDDEVIVREQAQYPDDEDCFVVINREHIPTIVRHLLDAAGLENIRMVRHLGGESFEDFEDFETALRHTRPDLDLDAALAEFDAKHITEPSEAVPKDKTGAERQRRLREKRRNGGVTADGEHPAFAAAVELAGAP